MGTGDTEYRTWLAARENPSCLLGLLSADGTFDAHWVRGRFFRSGAAALLLFRSENSREERTRFVADPVVH